MLLMVLAMAETVSGAARSAMDAPPVAQAAPIMGPAAMPVVAAVPPVAADPSALPPVSAAPAQSTSAAVSAPISLPDASVQTAYIAQPRDPWVKANRGIFAFDTALERSLLAPVSHGYVHVVPHVVRYHVTSALFNLGEPLTAVNDLLQLRVSALGKTVYRFVINSTFGIAGLFDVAKSAGVPSHLSDFGQTLGRYGLKPGNYIVLPLLGPSNVRDGFGRLVDNFIDPVEFLIGGITTPEGASLFAFEGVDWRSRSDETLKAVYGATDPYAFTRSAYSQSRAATIAEATGKQVALPDFDAPAGTP